MNRSNDLAWLAGLLEGDFMTEKQPGLRECCVKPENLVVRAGGEIITLTTGELYVVPFGDDGDLVIRQCLVCQARHFEQSVDPGELGIALKDIA